MSKVKRCFEAGLCSHCGSDSVSYGGNELDGNSIGYHITCDDCGLLVLNGII